MKRHYGLMVPLQHALTMLTSSLSCIYLFSREKPAIVTYIAKFTICDKDAGVRLRPPSPMKVDQI